MRNLKYQKLFDKEKIHFYRASMLEKKNYKNYFICHFFSILIFDKDNKSISIKH